MSIKRSLRVLTAASLLTVTFLAAQPPQAAYAQSIEINSTVDVIADDGQCTLREAIIAANTDTASGTLAGECRTGNGEDVVYVPNGTYTLTSGSELTIDSNLWLVGQSEAGTIIQAAAAPDTVNYRVITINGNNNRIGRLTIRHGGCNDTCGTPGPTVGGGLLNQGAENYLHNVTITLNRASQRGNGFFHAAGRMTFHQSTITANNAPAGSLVLGGGGYNTGQLYLFNSTVTNNVLSGPNHVGGGIANYGELWVNNSIFSANLATVGSNILSSGTRVGIRDTTLSNNPGSDSLRLYSNADIIASTVSDNGSGSNGGISVGSNVQITIRNSTITGHSTYGIYFIPGSTASVSVVNSTIASNGGNGIIPASGSVNVVNTIIANNPGGDCAASIGTGGYNITSDNSCFLPPQPTDQISTNPLLGALANNGGPTQTMALQAGSPAIDIGSSTACANTTTGAGNVDQRGAERPFNDPATPGTACDIGAVEFGATSDDYPDTYVYSANVVEDNTLNAVVPYTDPDGSPLGGGISFGSGPVHEQAVNLDMAGNLTYTPLPNFNGYDAFIYEVVQQDPPLLGRYRTVYMLALIQVDPENDPPVNTVPATATVVVSTPTGIGGVSVADPDVDENPGGQMQVTLTATNGTVSVPGTSGATVNNNGTANVTITGTLAQLNTELAGIQFTGTAVGPATLQVLSSDLGNWGAPGVLTDTDTINITVTDTPPPAPSGGGGGGAVQASASGCIVTIDVEADKEVVSLGDPVWWTIEVRNPGPEDCHGLTVTGTMPGEFVIRDIATSQGTITRDDPRFEVNLGTLSVDQLAEIDIDSLLVGGAGFELPEGAAGQSAGTQLCLTGYLNTTLYDTDCVILFPDNLPSTGGQPVNWWKHYGVWIVSGLIGLLVVGGWWVIGRKRHRAGRLL